MIAILKFKVPEERDDFKMAYNGSGYKCILDEMDNYLRGVIKYDQTYAAEQLEIFQIVRDKLHDLMHDLEL